MQKPAGLRLKLLICCIWMLTRLPSAVTYAWFSRAHQGSKLHTPATPPLFPFPLTIPYANFLLVSARLINCCRMEGYSQEISVIPITVYLCSWSLSEAYFLKKNFYLELKFLVSWKERTVSFVTWQTQGNELMIFPFRVEKYEESHAMPDWVL